jgi:hypothetical protein
MRGEKVQRANIDRARWTRSFGHLGGLVEAALDDVLIE